MASVSLPAPTPMLTNTSLHTPSMSVSHHTRKHSRNPTVSPPVFSFNPGSLEKDTENEPPTEDTMASKPASRRVARPTPLPSFSFNPGADHPVEGRSSPVHPVLEEMVMNQQRMSRSARPAPLPAFTFAPSGTAQSTPSPTKSDFSEAIHARPVTGHKRAGSEFVGGGGVEGPTLLSTSPQKHEAKPSGPPVTGAGRRGHAHRRSQAVSISDIDTSDLIKAHALAKHRTNSTPVSGPTTPSDAPRNSFLENGSPQRQQIPMRSPPPSPRRRGSAPGVRPRVEFADKIDVIPRPLSMISSETEGSCSTVRYSHSLSNSINSIASPSRVPSTMTSPSLDSSPRQRPQTADPSTLLMSMNSSPDRCMSEVSLPKRPLSASGSPAMTSSGSPPIKKKHFWFTNSPERTPVSTPKSEKEDPLASLPPFAPSQPNNLVRPKTSPERSASFKRRKYHTWTTGIFSKKSKYRTPKAKPRRTPTPPQLQRRPSDKVTQIFDADDTVVLRASSPETKRSQLSINTNNVAVVSTSMPDDYGSPMIDLDAAFGPSSSEDKSENEHHTRSSRIAKLHSSERRGNIDAFGTVHRRTESAPNMPAFTRSGFGFARQGSNPSLAEEVFDEEEEDIFLAGQKRVQATVSSPKREAVRSSSNPSVPFIGTDHVDGLGLSNVTGSGDAVVIVDSDQDIGADDMRSSKSTIEAPLFADADVPKRPVSSPLSFAYPSTQSHYASSTEGRTTTSASMISSPDPDHVHFDNVPRLAPGAGHQSPEFYLRPSNDDLPSLSDSISSGAIPRASSCANTRSSVDQRHEHRSASMIVPGTSRSNQSWKRSSLASLNRLIPGSANGSRLKFETTPEIPSDEKSKKKPNRLSKLVSFWRAKEKVDK